MRWTLLIAFSFFVLPTFLVACGGDDDSTTDAAVPDAPTTDASIDAPSGEDAPDVEREPATDIGDEGQEVWVFMQSHLHTTGFHDCANSPRDPGLPPEGQCYAAEGILGFLQEGLANNASHMIITDHNNIDAWFDPAFAPLADIDRTRYATPVRGTEWSSGDGHMTLFWPRMAVASNADALAMNWVCGDGNQEAVPDMNVYRDVIASVHAAGGIAVINHPELSIHTFPEDSLGADGVEVGIPPNPLDDWTGGAGLQSSKEARNWWQRRLVEGQRLAGTAGADHHHGGGDIPGLEAPTFGIAVNYVRIDPALPLPATVNDALDSPDATIDMQSDTMVDAIRRGHIMVTESDTAPRLFVGADVDGDGRFHDARAGDCISAAALGGQTSIRVRVRMTQVSSAGSSSHFNLLAWTEASASDELWKREVDYDTGYETASEYDIDPADPFTIELDVPVTGRGFIRFVLERDVVGPANDTEVVTNPIYFGDWGDECVGSAPLY